MRQMAFSVAITRLGLIKWDRNSSAGCGHAPFIEFCNGNDRPEGHLIVCVVLLY